MAKMTHTPTKTRFDVEFHTHANGLIRTGDGYTDDLVSVRTSKPLDLSAGTWSVTLKGATRDWIADLTDTDYVVIHGHVNGLAVPAMIGIVDSVSEGAQQVGGAATQRYTVQGRDLAGIVESTQVWFNDFGEYGTNVLGKDMQNILGFVPGGSPDQVVKKLFQGMLGHTTPSGFLGGHWKIPDSLATVINDEAWQAAVQAWGTEVGRAAVERDIYFADLVDTDALVEPLRGIQLNKGIYQPGAAGMTLTDQLKSWQNDSLNELFMDVRTGRAAVGRGVDPREGMGLGNMYAMVMRERPFLNLAERLSGKWVGLPVFTARAQDIDNVRVTRTGSERVNHCMLFEITSLISEREQYASAKPDFNKESIRLHGLRRFERRTNYVTAGSGLTSWLEESQRWQALMTNWYAMNHLFLRGEVTLNRIVPWARVGHRIRYPRTASGKDVNGYIEGVSHTWRASGHGQTVFQVTRGFEGDDNEYLMALQEEVSKFQVAGDLELLDEGFAPAVDQGIYDLGADELESANYA